MLFVGQISLYWVCGGGDGEYDGGDGDDRGGDCGGGGVRRRAQHTVRMNH